MIAQPRLEIAGGAAVDLGSMSRGKVVTKDLTLRNSGSEVLVIEKVLASCGCTGAMVSNDHIPPGKTGTLQITFNSKNFAGKVHKTVTVNSNAATNPKAVIEFSAFVVDEVALRPSNFMFNATVGYAASSSVVVKNEGKLPLQITDFKSQLEGLSLRLPAAPIAPGDSATIVASFTPKNAAALSDGVFLTTTNPNQPEVYVRIIGNVKEFKFE